MAVCKYTNIANRNCFEFLVLQEALFSTVAEVKMETRRGPHSALSEKFQVQAP